MTHPPDKETIAEILENIARLLEIKGENPFKIRAYTNAIKTVETYPGDLADAVRAGTLEDIPGIGKAIAEKISELVETGRLAYYDRLRDEFPPEILQLFEIQGLGGKKIKVLHDQLQVHSISRLERTCLDGRLAALPGFGQKTADNLLKSIELRRTHAGRFLRGDVCGKVEYLLAALREHPDVTRVSAAGSFRRSMETVHDLDFVASTRSPQAVLEYFASLDVVGEVIAKGDTKSSVRLKNGLQCDLRVVTDGEFPFALCYFTGSKEHNIALRARALKRGWTLNEYRLAGAEGKSGGAIPAIRDEPDLYRALDLDFIEPDLRENLGELEAAELGALPDLIEWTNLRGTFHNHTNESDGHATLEEMAQAAAGLGLAYLGISDHSKSSPQAHGLDENRLETQRRAIERRNAGSDDIHLFSGVECDILRDGSLDFSDDVLASLDFVVASIHSSFTMDEAEMTRRIIRAISNPHVTMLGHLTGRLLLSREPYRVDIPAVIEAAAETGTIIELNSNPRRLDMDWRWWRLAREKGVKCSINPDAHRVAGLGHLALGVGSARKGWLTRADVVNCLPLDQVRNVLAAKRVR